LRPFDARRDALTAADAQGDQGGFAAGPRHLVQCLDDRHRPGRPDRMAQRNRPAIGVHAGGIKAEVAGHGDGLRRAGLVQLF